MLVFLALHFFSRTDLLNDDATILFSFIFRFKCAYYSCDMTAAPLPPVLMISAASFPIGKAGSYLPEVHPEMVVGGLGVCGAVLQFDSSLGDVLQHKGFLNCHGVGFLLHMVGMVCCSSLMCWWLGGRGEGCSLVQTEINPVKQPW